MKEEEKNSQHHAYINTKYKNQRNKQINKYFDTYRNPIACDSNVSEQILMLIRIGFYFIFMSKKSEIEIETMESN